jgi:hypothetical protein
MLDPVNHAVHAQQPAQMATKGVTAMNPPLTVPLE